MQFKKFSSLENTYNKKLIEKIRLEGLDKGLWIVTSKLHGANFSFWYDGVDFKVASRTQFVDGTFFNCQKVINEYEDNFKAWYHKTHAVGTVVVVYGELFGKGIQKEVNYGEKKFRAFDVVVDGIVIDKMSAQHIASAAGFEWVPIRTIGDFESCLSVPNLYRSVFTPEDHIGENFEEGNVIEPVEPKFFGSGKRVYLKNKNESFKEKNNKVSHKEPVSISDDNKKLLEDVMGYVTENRVKNALSKMGVLSQSQFGKLLGETVRDALEEFEEDTEISLKNVAASDWSVFIKTLKNYAAKIVRPVFLEQLDD